MKIVMLREFVVEGMTSDQCNQVEELFGEFPTLVNQSILKRVIDKTSGYDDNYEFLCNIHSEINKQLDDLYENYDFIIRFC